MSSLPIDQSATYEQSSEASTSYKTQLPDKKTFIATLSGTAFVVGLTGATIYGLRKAKLQALKEAQEAAKAAVSSTSSTVAAVSAPAALQRAVPAALSRTQPTARNQQDNGGAASEGKEVEASGSTSAFGLFRQMNAAILNPSKRTARISSDNSAKGAPTSVFDDETCALPSVLRRRKASPASSSSSSSVQHSAPILASSTSTASTSSAHSSSSSSATATLPNLTETKIDYSEMDSTLDFLGLSSPVPREEQERMKALDEQAANEEAPQGFFQSPVGLSLKAFFIATSIVTFSTLATVEVTKRLLGVETMDEFVVAMTKIIPSRQRGEASLQGAAPHMRVNREGDDLQGASNAGKPKLVDEALTDLSNASSFEEWVTTLKSQLDTERDYEVKRRFAGINASNDSISATSRSYPVHSLLELEDLERNTAESVSFFRSVLAISPVLPSTAFGLGLISGLLTSGKRAGLVFMAENAHRLPDTVQGWYFYSKTKNYKVLLGAAKGGLKQGARLGIWTTGFCFAERFAELTRGYIQRQINPEGKEGIKVLGHWTDGALAGVGTAAAATALYRLPKPSAVRVFQLGLLAGASTGGIRDLQERLVHKEIGGVASHT